MLATVALALLRISWALTAPIGGLTTDITSMPLILGAVHEWNLYLAVLRQGLVPVAPIMCVLEVRLWPGTQQPQQCQLRLRSGVVGQ